MENYQFDFNNVCYVPSNFPVMDNSYMVFQQLSYQMQKQNQEIASLKIKNQKLKSQLNTLKRDNTFEEAPVREVQVSQAEKPIEKKRKPIRTFYCDYDNCDRVYASTLALSLHIKTKHNGGTKIQRDAYAKLIVMAELNGQPLPKFNFNFPSNQVESFRQKHLQQLKNKLEVNEINNINSQREEHQF